MKLSSFSLLDFYGESGETPGSRWAAIHEQAALAERLGFETFWVAEHHAPKPALSPNPAVALSAIAQRTSTLRLGSAVSVLPLRRPIAVAEDYAMLHVASGGRLDMGVGTGSQPDEYEALGVAFEERRQAFDAALKEIKAIWSDRSGADAAQASPLLAVAAGRFPPPRFYVATASEDGAYRTGLAGDGLLTMIAPVLADPSEITLRIRAHERGLAEAGHPPRDAVVAVFSLIAPTTEELRHSIGPAVRRLARHWFGVPEEHQASMADRILGLGTSLLCNEAEADDRMARYAALGIRHLALISDFGGLGAGVSRNTMEKAADACG